jgi:Family of unknown function (DUF6578)
MAVWRVYVDDWQLECCGDPFAVGDEVAWTLVLSDRHSLPPEFETDFDGAVVGTVSDGVITGSVARVGSLYAFVEDAQSADGRLRVRGLLKEDHHGAIPGEIPRTHGTVRQIQVVTRPYVRVGTRSWFPRGDEVELRDVARSPERFDTAEVQPGLQMSETGLLVELDVDDPCQP